MSLYYVILFRSGRRAYSGVVFAVATYGHERTGESRPPAGGCIGAQSARRIAHRAAAAVSSYRAAPDLVADRESARASAANHRSSRESISQPRYFLRYH